MTLPFDTELFGHWWFEGPQFIDFFFRKLHFDQSEIVAITPGDFLDSGIPIQRQRPTRPVVVVEGQLLYEQGRHSEPTQGPGEP